MKIKQFSSQFTDLYSSLHCLCAFVLMHIESLHCSSTSQIHLFDSWTFCAEVHELKFTLDSGSLNEGLDRAEVAPLYFRAAATNSWFVLTCIVRICSLPCRSSGAASGPQYACPSSEADAPICLLSSAKSAPTHTHTQEKHVVNWLLKKIKKYYLVKEKCGIAHVLTSLLSSLQMWSQTKSF